LRPGAASSYSVGFRWRVAQFALPLPPLDVAVFRRDSFDHRRLDELVGAYMTALVGYRPPAPFG
jgi:thioesterase domain-containing protein